MVKVSKSFKNVKTLIVILFALILIVFLLSLITKKERYVNSSTVDGYDKSFYSFASLEGFENAPENTKTIYLFHAKWCGHCQEYLNKKDPKTNKNVFETISTMSELKAYTFKALDFDENKELATKFGVNSFPTIIKVITVKDKEPVVKVFEGDRDNVQQIVDFVKSP